MPLPVVLPPYAYLWETMRMSASALLAEVPDLPDHVARRLLLAATGGSAASLLGDPVIGDAARQRFWANVARRRRGEPLQYIEGVVQFGPITLRIDSRALIPRPETEHLWELAVEALSDIATPVVVDLCTGSGNLALACKTVRPDARVIGSDRSAATVSLARDNAAQLGLVVDFYEGDLFEPLPGEFLGRVHVLVSNPPYVAAEAMARLPSEVRDHEPAEALLAGPDGTEVLARIAAQASTWLRPGGRVICEIGETQSEACLRLFAVYEPRIETDLTGRPRYVVGTAPE
jgi:release factor glutamine methyltransferase